MKFSQPGFLSKLYIEVIYCKLSEVGRVSYPENPGCFLEGERFIFDWGMHYLLLP